MASWKRDFASGLVILTPLLVTVIVLLWLYNWLARVPIPVESEPVRVVVTIVVFVLLVFAVGYLMRTAVGSILEAALDDAMNHVPGLRVIYNASKMAAETAFSGSNSLQTPVRLEVWEGLRMTAYKTGKQTEDGRDILFLPTAPNITTGFVIEVHSDRYTESDETVEESLTRILSAGFGGNGKDPLGEIFDEQERSRLGGLRGTDGDTEDGDGDDDEFIEPAERSADSASGDEKKSSDKGEPAETSADSGTESTAGSKRDSDSA